jgi:hypothetical protein
LAARHAIVVQIRRRMEIRSWFMNCAYIIAFPDGFPL